MTTTHNADLSPSVQIANSQVYEEFITLRPVPALPDAHEFLIRSRLDSAKDPQALQTRHCIVLTRDALVRIHRYLGEYLQSQATEEVLASS